MSVKSAPMDGGGFDVHRALDFEKRSAGKNGDVEAFIKKVDAVHVAIQAMKARYLRQATLIYYCLKIPFR